MKTMISVVAFIALLFTSIVYASESNATTSSYASSSPQVCQFSLSHYTGTISSGSTDGVSVGLSCPQGTDTYATVVVVIDGELVASEVIKVPAGKTRSDNNVCIKVGASYNGKSYKLGVQ